MVCFFVVFITIQQVCTLAALTVRKHKLDGKNPIGVADLEWIFACNYACRACSLTFFQMHDS